MISIVRTASLLSLFASLATPLLAQDAASDDKAARADAESKLAIALRSFSLVDKERDQLKEANEKLSAEKAALEARLAEAQAAIPIAAQVVALREQLRQTQAQMAAYAEENVQLKSRLSLGGAHTAPTTAGVAPAPAPAAPPAPVPAKPAQRTHVIASGDTLLKISQTYYGTPNRWSEILAANREVLRDEKSLVIGKSLVIP